MNQLLNDPDVMLLRNMPPQQADFMSVVFNFTESKLWNKVVPTAGFEALSLGGNQYALFLQGGGIHTTWIDNRGTPIAKPVENFEGKKPSLIVKVNKQQFDDAHTNWINYWTWKKNRNATRSELEEQFGYDTKHAMHLVRLLRMGVEALTEGVLHVKRADAQELLTIRHGAWTYEQVIEYATEMDAKIQQLLATTSLPRDVDRLKIATLLLEVQDWAWSPLRRIK